MRTATKRIERLEAKQQPPAAGNEGPKTWKEFVTWPAGKPLPGWSEFYKQAKGLTDEKHTEQA